MESHTVTPARSLASWSGGKDSMLALHRAQQLGLQVTGLLTMMNESQDVSRSHAVPLAVMQAQARALGMELITASASWADYERVFIDTLIAQKARSFSHCIFGDIDLQPHRDWEEKVCAAAGLQACLPLWQERRSDLVQELLALGFRAIVVCVNGRWLDERFCGRQYDAQFLADLPPGVDACGENGEFHTFVYDGPGFAQPVNVTVSQRTRYQAPASLGGDTYHFAQLALDNELHSAP